MTLCGNPTGPAPAPPTPEENEFSTPFPDFAAYHHAVPHPLSRPLSSLHELDGGVLSTPPDLVPQFSPYGGAPQPAAQWMHSDLAIDGNGQMPTPAGPSMFSTPVDNSDFFNPYPEAVEGLDLERQQMSFSFAVQGQGQGQGQTSGQPSPSHQFHLPEWLPQYQYPRAPQPQQQAPPFRLPPRAIPPHCRTNSQTLRRHSVHEDAQDKRDAERISKHQSRRLSHNIVEKRYRVNLNRKFHLLQTVVKNGKELYGYVMTGPGAELLATYLSTSTSPPNGSGLRPPTTESKVEVKAEGQEQNQPTGAAEPLQSAPSRNQKMAKAAIIDGALEHIEFLETQVRTLRVALSTRQADSTPGSGSVGKEDSQGANLEEAESKGEKLVKAEEKEDDEQVLDPSLALNLELDQELREYLHWDDAIDEDEDAET